MGLEFRRVLFRSLRSCITMWLEKGGSFTFPFYPLWIVSICFTQTPPTHFIKIKWAKDLSFCMTKRRKKRDEFRLPKSSLFFLKPWMNEPKISRILVRSSTKNMRPVSLQSILVLQVKNFAT